MIWELRTEIGYWSQMLSRETCGEPSMTHTLLPSQKLVETISPFGALREMDYSDCQGQGVVRRDPNPLLSFREVVC